MFIMAMVTSTLSNSNGDKNVEPKYLLEFYNLNLFLLITSMLLLAQNLFIFRLPMIHPI